MHRLSKSQSRGAHGNHRKASRKEPLPVRVHSNRSGLQPGIRGSTQWHREGIAPSRATRPINVVPGQRQMIINTTTLSTQDFSGGPRYTQYPDGTVIEHISPTFSIVVSPRTNFIDLGNREVRRSKSRNKKCNSSQWKNK